MKRASEAIKAKPLPKLGHKGAPIKVTELVKRRHAKAVADLQRAIEQREELFAKLARQHSKIWKIARQVQRYEKLVA